METQLSILEVLEVIEKLQELKANNQDLTAYTNPGTLSQVATKLSAGQKELLGALIAYELEKSL